MRIRVFLAVASVAPAFLAGAAGTRRQEAQFTQVVNDVQLLSAHAELEPAKPNDELQEGAEVRTSAESRAEIGFRDQTVARLGANTVFTFKNGAHNMRLSDGVILVQAPGGMRGAKLQTDGVAATIKGTTAVFEFHPTSYKFLVLQGTGRLYRLGHLGDSILVRAGQMVIGNPKTGLSAPVDFDVGRFVKTCPLIVDFPPLRSQELMAKESAKQLRAKSKRTLLDTNLVIFGKGTVVSLTNPALAASDDLGTIEPPPSAPPPAESPATLPINRAAEISR